MSGGGSRVPLSSNLATPTAYKTPHLVKHGEGVLSFPGLYHECIPKRIPNFSKVHRALQSRVSDCATMCPPKTQRGAQVGLLPQRPRKLQPDTRREIDGWNPRAGKSRVPWKRATGACRHGKVRGVAALPVAFGRGGVVGASPGLFELEVFHQVFLHVLGQVVQLPERHLLPFRREAHDSPESEVSAV